MNGLMGQSFDAAEDSRDQKTASPRARSRSVVTRNLTRNLPDKCIFRFFYFPCVYLNATESNKYFSDHNSLDIHYIFVYL